MSEYYLNYEERYQAVQAVGDYLWGHLPDDHQLVAALNGWVDEHDLRSKSIVEFACGEGVCAEMLCRMGCAYQGYDIAPTAVDIARRRIANFPHAQISRLDMVKEALSEGSADGVLDVSGLHMLVTDSDRCASCPRARKPARATGRSSRMRALRSSISRKSRVLTSWPPPPPSWYASPNSNMKNGPVASFSTATGPFFMDLYTRSGSGCFSGWKVNSPSCAEMITFSPILTCPDRISSLSASSTCR